jgi:hypothetical protein
MEGESVMFQFSADLTITHRPTLDAAQSADGERDS